MLRKAVVLAGGHGSRLGSLTTATNKHMLPVYDRPMIQRTIEAIVSWGITDIMVLLNNHFVFPIMRHMENGKNFGCSICYGYENDPVGPCFHLRMARGFVGEDDFLLIGGDSFYSSPLVLDDIKTPHTWVMPLGDFDDFRKYAEVELDPDSRVVGVTEKPLMQTTGIIQTNAWAFPSDVFGRCERLVHDSAGEVQIRTVVKEYVTEGVMTASVLPPRSFLDLGTPEALHRASQLARQERDRQSSD
jgi:glucose-1-phosphate thymidylyltransferase